VLHYQSHTWVELSVDIQELGLEGQAVSPSHEPFPSLLLTLAVFLNTSLHFSFSLLYPVSNILSPSIPFRSVFLLGCGMWGALQLSQQWVSEQGLTSPPTQYKLSGRQFYRSKDPTNSMKVLKEESSPSRARLPDIFWCFVDWISCIRVWILRWRVDG